MIMTLKTGRCSLRAPDYFFAKDRLLSVAVRVAETELGYRTVWRLGTSFCEEVVRLMIALTTSMACGYGLSCRCFPIWRPWSSVAEHGNICQSRRQCKGPLLSRVLPSQISCFAQGLSPASNNLHPLYQGLL